MLLRKRPNQFYVAGKLCYSVVMSAIDYIRKRLPIERWREPDPVIAVLPLVGVIGGLGQLRRGLNLHGLAPRIERAFKVKNLVGVALAVNSPGGSPVQSALIGKRIRDLAKEKEVPVYAFIEDEWKVNENLKMNGGLHFANLFVQGESYHSLQPRFGMNYSLPGGLAFKTSYAEMMQFVNLLTNLQ